ncbi:MAG: tRNA 2-thiouridine(34) synthase MnmA [Clostridia bacterium]|nr:tRNA 2-thiouridine(34) synthase MnmA [Clostridia bacterium]
MKILVALSGGVDSSAAAALLLREGCTVGGATMRLCPGDGEDPSDDARSAAKMLGIPFFLFDMREEFRKSVISDFIEAYKAGKTPNPCVVCNRDMKFGAFIDRAEELGYEKIATGHYAKIKKSGDRYLLYKSENDKKDQSYVLWSLSQRALSRLVLPLGALTKEEAREAAALAGLENANKKESQDICFVPDGDYAGFILRETGAVFPEGDFVTENGAVIGRHKGIIHYTVGQRRGLGLALPAPLYVKAKDAEGNRVILCPPEGLMAASLEAESVNWIAFDALDGPVRLEAKIRYGAKSASCTVTPLEEGKVRVLFDEPQRAISPGQSVVFYDGDLLAGGGIIK